MRSLGRALLVPLALLIFAVGFVLHVVLPRLFGLGNGWTRRRGS